MSDIVILDTETLGLHPDAPIWEFAAIRRTPDGAERRFHCFIDHISAPWIDDMPEAFVKDYEHRYQAHTALTAWNAATMIYTATKDACVIGVNPGFDVVRLGKLLDRIGFESEPWDYTPICMKSMTAAYLAARGEILHPPWSSEELSRAVGINPANYERHTAMGDVYWARDLYDVVMAQQKAELPS